MVAPVHKYFVFHRSPLSWILVFWSWSDVVVLEVLVVLVRRRPHVVVCSPPGRKVVYAQDLEGTTVRSRCLMRLAVVWERQDFHILRQEALGASWFFCILAVRQSSSRPGSSESPGH